MIARLGVLLACCVLGATGYAGAADSASLNFKISGLLTMCKSDNGDPRKSMCIGYVSGVGDTMGLLGDDKKATDKTYAMCGTPSYGAMVQAFINWGEKHPEHWERPREVGVVLALRELWPCK